eukprot:1449562-Rhodomonas_salina.1
MTGVRKSGTTTEPVAAMYPGMGVGQKQLPRYPGRQKTDDSFLPSLNSYPGSHRLRVASLLGIPTRVRTRHGTPVIGDTGPHGLGEQKCEG